MGIDHLAAKTFPLAQRFDSVEKHEVDLARHRYVVVMDGDAFVGLLTMADVLRRPRRLVVDCIGTKPTAQVSDALDAVLALMEQHTEPFLPVFDGSAFVGVIGYKSVVDQLQEERTSALAVYRDIFEAANDAILVVDRGPGAIVDANPAACELCGLSLQALRTMSLREVLVPGSDDATDDPPLSRVPSRRELRRLGGAMVPVEVSTRDAIIGGQERTVVVARDVSLSLELAAQRAVVEQLRAQRVMASGLAHDINNALTALFVEFDEATLANDLDEAQRAVSGANGVLRSIRDIVAELQMFARDSAPTRGSVALADIVRQWAPLAARAGEVTLDLHLGDVPNVEANPRQLGQVVHNLVLNATQACAQGGRVVVTLQEVTPPDLGGELAVELVVEDNGHGVAPQHKARIFEPYFTTQSSGHGLGLAVVRSVVDGHGGLLELDSKLGHGTRVSVVLPCRAH